MKQLTVTKIGNPETKELGTMEIRNVEIPAPSEEDILIKVAYNGICGSDGHTMKGDLGPMREFALSMLPMPIGHEISGVVETVGAKAAAAGFKPGDRVVGNYFRPCGSCYYCSTGRENFCQMPGLNMSGAAEYVCWHMSQVYKIPDEISLKDAAMAEPFTIAFNAVEMARVKMGSRVAVFGGGGIGQMAVQIAKNAGASVVTLFEPVAEKRELAISLGADYAYDSINEDVKQVAKEITNGLGFDCVIEASGAKGAAISAIDILSIDGDVVYFSMYPTDFEMPLNLFEHCYSQQKHIHGMNTSAGIWPRAIAMMPRIELTPLIQKVYDLEDFVPAFADHLSGGYAKVMLCCNKDLA